jgi:phosphotransferase system HPr (HPr) family protein
MADISIMLSSINDVKNFVNTVSRYDCDVDLVSGRYIVDAKSIMGIFSLDLTKPITVQIQDGTDSEKLVQEIETFIVK